MDYKTDRFLKRDGRPKSLAPVLVANARGFEEEQLSHFSKAAATFTVAYGSE